MTRCRDLDNLATCKSCVVANSGAGNPNSYQTVIVAPQLKRQLGLRVSWKF